MKKLLAILIVVSLSIGLLAAQLTPVRDEASRREKTAEPLSRTRDQGSRALPDLNQLTRPSRPSIPPVTRDTRLFEGFEGTTGFALPVGWTKAGGQGANGWRTAGPDWAGEGGLAVNSEAQVHAGSRVLARSWASASPNNWVFSSGFTLTSGTTYNISFYYLAPGYNGTDVTIPEPDNFELRIGTTATAAGMATAPIIFSQVNLPFSTDFTGLITEWNFADLTFTPTSSNTYYLAFHDLNPSQYGFFIIIDDVHVFTPEDNDLAALSIIGPFSISLNTSTNFTINVQNVGLQAVAAGSYTVRLMQGTTVLNTVNGVALAPGATHPFIISHSFTTDGTLAVHGNVLWAADDNQANNSTNPMNIIVFPEGTVYLGDPESTAYYLDMPFDYYYYASISQTIYRENEINMAGVITDMIYRFVGVGNVAPNTNHKIWMATTTNSQFANTTSWIPYADFTLVYEGTLPVNVDDYADIPITLQNPYPYDSGNLVIMTQRMSTGQWFNNNGWLCTATPDEPRTIISRRDGADYDPANLGEADFIAPFIVNVQLNFNTSGLGTLMGNITSSAGGPIEGATVSVVGATNSTTTNATGFYTLPYLSAGTISITISAYMHQTRTIEGIVITEDGETTQDAILQATGSDLNLLTFNGTRYPTASHNNPYRVNVRSEGTETIQGTAYTVKLMRENATGNDTELVSVPGVILNSNQTHEFVLLYSPAVNLVGQTFSVYAYVDFSADQNMNNNTSSSIPLQIQPAGQAYAYIGNPASTTSSNAFPVNYYYMRSMTQTIYLEDEINASGFLSQLTYRFTGTANPIPEGIPVQIYLATTTISAFPSTAATSWVPFADFNLVYDGPLPVSTTGTYDVEIDLDVPYSYEGGNLVVMMVKNHTVYYDMANVWQNTATPGQNRTIHVRVDTGADYSPTNYPVASGVEATAPNIGMTFLVGGVGNLTGSVTHNGAPLAGAMVQVNGTTRNATSNADGVYSIANIFIGTYSITASRLGFHDTTIPSIVITDGGNTTQDIPMTQLPTVTVSGTVIASDTSDGLEGASIRLTGYENYQNITTDSSGQFTIPGVYTENTYTINVTKEGYRRFQDINIVVGTEDLTLPNIMLYVQTDPDLELIYEGFEDTSGFELPFGWTKEGGQGEEGWRTIDSGSLDGIEDPTPVHNGDRVLARSWLDASPSNWAFSHDFELVAGVEAIISFYYLAPGYGYFETDDFEVKIGTSANSVAMSASPTIFSNIGNNTDYQEFEYAEVVYMPTTTGTYYLGFHDLTPAEEGFYIVIDDVQVLSYYVSDKDIIEIPVATSLRANYPNPFNPSTTITFDKAIEGNVRIDIYNIKGQRVKSLIDTHYTAGHHKVEWNGTDENGSQVSSGIYFYQMRTEEHTATRKMMMLK